MPGRDDPGGDVTLEVAQQRLLELTTHDAVVEGDLEEAARGITEAAAEILDVPRVNVWLFEDGHDRLRCVDHYDRADDAHESGLELDAAEYETYVEALRGHRSIDASDARADPRTAELAEPYLRPNDVHSLLDATLRDEGEVVGVVCHEQTGGPREWTDSEVGIATHVAEIVHRALRNHRSERRRKELDVQRSMLKAQQEAMPDGVVVISDEEGVVSHNDRFLDLLDLSAADLEGTDHPGLFEAIRPKLADPEAVDAAFERLTAAPDNSGRTEVELADDRVLDVYTTPVRDGEDHQFGRLWLVRDVTDRRERERELELMNRAIEEAPIGITISESDGPDNPLVYANERFEQLTGYAYEDVEGLNCRFLQGPGTAAEPVADLRSAIADERSVTTELRNYRADGSQFWNRVSVAPVTDDEGAVTNYVGFQEDVTDRREATRQLRVLHRVLRHNLANHLSVVRGYAEQLGVIAEGEAQSVAGTVVEEIDELLSVVDDHRKVVQLLSDQPSPRPLSLGGVLEGAVDDVRSAHPDATVTLEQVDDCEVLAIPQLRDALGELLTNGVVHADQAAPTVTVDVEETDDGVALRVVDEGPGVPEEEASILRGEQEVDPLYHGVGMGLWFVYWVVRLSEGEVVVERTGPSGTTVRVDLTTPGGA